MGKKERKKERPEHFPFFLFPYLWGGRKGELKRMAKNTAIKMTHQNNKYPPVWKRRGEEALGSERGKVKGRKEKKRKEKKRKRKKGKREKEIWKLLSRKCSGLNRKVLEGDRQTPENNKGNKVENNLMQQKLLPWENQYNQ